MNKATTYEIRKARKPYKCTEVGWHTIHLGDKYLYGALPPWHEVARGRKWEIIRACLRCADHFGLHTSETRLEAEK